MLHRVRRAVRFSDRQRQGITGSTAFRYRDFGLHTVLQLFGIHAVCCFRNGHYRCCIHHTVTVSIARDLSIDSKVCRLALATRVTCRVCDFRSYRILAICRHFIRRNGHSRFTCSHFICGQRVLHRVRRAVRFSDRQRQGITGSTAFRYRDFGLHTVLQLFGIHAVCCFRNGYYRCCICCTITIGIPRDLGIGSKINHIPGLRRVTALSQTDTDAVLPVNHRILRNIHGYFTGSHFIFSHGMRHVLRGFIRTGHSQCNNRTFCRACRQRDLCLQTILQLIGIGITVSHFRNAQDRGICHTISF